MKKTPHKQCQKSNLYIPVLTDLWLGGKLHGNSRFCRVTLHFCNTPGTTLKMSSKTAKMSLEKSCQCLNFFLETCTHHDTGTVSACVILNKHWDIRYCSWYCVSWFSVLWLQHWVLSWLQNWEFGWSWHFIDYVLCLVPLCDKLELCKYVSLTFLFVTST